MLRSRNTPHISGRASDLESQPMSVIEEDEVQNTELYNTQEFPVSGTDDSQPERQPPPVVPYAHDESENEALREDIRKALLKQASPILSMARQIAGSANLEMHRVIRQEVKEQTIDYVFQKIQPEVKKSKAKQRAELWLQEAKNANSVYMPTYDIVKLYKLNVFLKIQLPYLYIGIKVNDNLTLFKYSLNLGQTDAISQTKQIFWCLQKANVYGTDLGYDTRSDNDVMHRQKVEFDKFNIDELRGIVEQFENVMPDTKDLPNLEQTITIESPLLERSVDRQSRISSDSTGSEAGSVDPVRAPPSINNGRAMFAGEQLSIAGQVQEFVLGNGEIVEWETRIETHVLEACQIVYDTLCERGERIGSVEDVQKRMIEEEDGADMGSRLLFARVCANRINFSTEMAPKQSYLQARFGRLRQQFALLLVNLRRLHFKDNKFTLDTSIPRRAVRIY